MSTLAYGWVEHWSDVASCGPASSPDKYSCAFNLCNCICLINYYEHDECLNVLNECDFASVVYFMNNASMYVFNSMHFYYHIHGARSPI